MYERFRLDLDFPEIDSIIDGYEFRSEINKFPDISDSIIEKLSSNHYDVFNANKIIEDHFNINHYDVFISHSYGDIKKVKKLAAYLEENNLKVFIDSLYWDSAYSVLRALDDKYSRNSESELYDYDKRNKTTSIIFSLLSVSLEKMIDSCDSFLYLHSANTNGANQVSSFNDQNSDNHTISPWIYQEIITANIIYKNQEIARKERVVKRHNIPQAAEKTLFFKYDLGEEIENYTQVTPKNILSLLKNVELGWLNRG